MRNIMNILKDNTKTLILIFLFIFIFSNTAFAQGGEYRTLPKDEWDRTPLLPDDLQEKLIDGITNLHSFDFDAAEESFKDAIRIAPDRVFGYIYVATLNWVRLYEDNFNKDAETKLLNYLAKSLEIGKEALTKEGANSYDYLYFALAKIMSVRTHIKNNNYPMALVDFLDALKKLRAASAFKDGNIDVEFGLGLYNAYTGALPKYILNILTQITSMKTNITQGIRQIRNVMDNGTLFKIESKLLMVNIEGAYASRYNMGRRIAGEVYNDFPLNMINNFMIMDLDSRYNYYERALKFSEEKIEKVLFNKMLDEQRRKKWIQKLNYTKGRIEFDKKNYSKAKEIFIDLILEGEEEEKNNPGYKYKNDPNVVGSFFRLGLIFDLERKRNKAVSCYKIVMDSDIVTTMKDYANMFLERRYVEGDSRINIKYYQEYYIP